MVCCFFRAFVENEKIRIIPNIRNMKKDAMRISIFGVLCFFFGSLNFMCFDVCVFLLFIGTIYAVYRMRQ